MANEQVNASLSTSVMVGCKLPHGLWLELIPQAPKDSWNPPPHGSRVQLNGANSVQSNSLLKINPRVLGFGKTIVGKDMWDKCVASGRYNELISKGFLFIIEPKGGAEATDRSFRSQANEKLSEKTGLEGLNPEGKDDRMKKIAIPGHPETMIESDIEHLKKLRQNMGD